MEGSALISVIVPIYNVEQYLDKCIRSVCDQTYRQLEIVLVDDGSKDSSSLICDEWRKKDHRIKVIHKKNGGLSDARNVGLKAATGKYIFFLDSDDYIDCRAIEILLDNLKASGAELVICSYQYIGDDGVLWEKTSSTTSPIKDEILKPVQAMEKLQKANRWFYVTAWNKLYTREALKDIEFPIGKLHEDMFVAHKVFANCRTISCVEQGLYYYVQRSGSIMAHFDPVRHLDSIEAYVLRYNFYAERGYTQCCEDTLKVMRDAYDYYRWFVPIRLPLNKRKRVLEVDKMFYRLYFKKVKNSTIKEKIKYLLPDIVLIYSKIKNKLNFDEK